MLLLLCVCVQVVLTLNLNFCRDSIVRLTHAGQTADCSAAIAIIVESIVERTVFWLASHWFGTAVTRVICAMLRRQTSTMGLVVDNVDEVDQSAAAATTTTTTTRPLVTVSSAAEAETALKSPSAVAIGEDVLWNMQEDRDVQRLQRLGSIDGTPPLRPPPPTMSVPTTTAKLQLPNASTKMK